MLGNAANGAAQAVAVDMELQNINVRQMTLSAMKPQLENSLNSAKGFGSLNLEKLT